MKFLTRCRDDRGAAILEYGLLAALISLLSFSAVTLVGYRTEETFDGVASAVDGPGGGEPVSSPSSESEGDSGGAPAATTTTTAPATSTTTAAATTTTTAAASATTTGPLPEEEEQTETGGHVAAAVGSGSEISTWNANKNGGNGTWIAMVDFANDWVADQLLTLRVTTIEHDGKKKTTTIEDFPVPAGSTAGFAHDGNTLKANKGKITGVMEVQVEVLSITTRDADGAPVTYPQESPVLNTVSRPDIP